MSDNALKLKALMREISSYVMLVIAAFSIEEFLVPCTILYGGIVGSSIMIKEEDTAVSGKIMTSVERAFPVDCYSKRRS